MNHDTVYKIAQEFERGVQEHERTANGKTQRASAIIARTSKLVFLRTAEVALSDGDDPLAAFETLAGDEPAMVAAMDRERNNAIRQLGYGPDVGEWSAHM